MEATLGAAMQTADVRAAQDAQSYRRRPVVNTELTAEERQLLQVRKCLIDGFYKAKACVSDSDFEFVDVQILDQLKGIAELLVRRSDDRLAEPKKSRNG